MQVKIPEPYHRYFESPILPGEARVEFGDQVRARGSVARVGRYESPLGSVVELTAVTDEEYPDELDLFVDELGPVAFEATAAENELDPDARAADGRLLAELLLCRMRRLEEDDSRCVALDATLIKAREELIGHAVLLVGAIDPPIAHRRCHGYSHGGTYVSLAHTEGNISVYGVAGGTRHTSVNNVRANGAFYVRGGQGGGAYSVSAGWDLTSKWSD